MNELRSLSARFIVSGGIIGLFFFAFIQDNIDMAFIFLFTGIIGALIVEKVANTEWYAENGFQSSIAKAIFGITFFLSLYLFILAFSPTGYLFVAGIFLAGMFAAYRLEMEQRDEFHAERVHEYLAEQKRAQRKREEEERRQAAAEERYRRDAPLRMEKELAALREELAGMNGKGGSSSSKASAELKRIKEQLAKMTEEKIKAENRARKAEQSGGQRQSGLTIKTAQELFEISPPYTAAELKKRRMDLLKKVHPDVGGSNMMAKMVNEAYELLKDNI